MPKLPSRLKTLICSYNPINQLPDLPESIKYIYCSYCNIHKIPKIPKGVKELTCYSNPLYDIHSSVLDSGVFYIDQWGIPCKNLWYQPSLLHTYIHKYFNHDFGEYINFKKYCKISTQISEMSGGGRYYKYKVVVDRNYIPKCKTQHRGVENQFNKILKNLGLHIGANSGTANLRQFDLD